MSSDSMHHQRNGLAVVIEARSVPLLGVKAHLETTMPGDVQVRIADSAEKSRLGLTEAVLIAAISTAGPVISTLLQELFRHISAKRRNPKIVIESGDTRVEVPANLPPEKLNALVESLRREPTITLILP